MQYRWIIHYIYKNDNINSYLNPHPPSWEVRNCCYGHHIDASDYSGNTEIVKVFNNVWIYAVLLVLYILSKVMKETSLKPHSLIAKISRWKKRGDVGNWRRKFIADVRNLKHWCPQLVLFLNETIVQQALKFTF
jgi:hypothetical protein